MNGCILRPRTEKRTVAFVGQSGQSPFWLKSQKAAVRSHITLRAALLDNPDSLLL
jgi:hypothetical protein